MKLDYEISAMTADDWPQVCAIYCEGLATGHATFQTEAPLWEAWNAAYLPHCRLVARAQDGLLGWIALSLGSSRACYAGVAEVSIYVAAAARGQDVGNALLQAVIAQSEQHGIWTLWASIFPENAASVRVHLRNGFREVGRRERIAQHYGVWRDTVILERRSKIVGVN